MPHMVYCGRFFRFATDEFSLPGICAIFIRIFWCALLATIIALMSESLNNCSNGEVILGYFSCSIIITVLTIICETIIVNISIKGTMVNESDREGITPYLSIHVILGFIQFASGVFGLCLFAENNLIPCSSETTNNLLVSALLLVTVITQIVDVSSLTCCFGLVYMSKKAELKPDVRHRNIFSSLFYSPSKQDLAVSTMDPSSFTATLLSSCQSLCKCLHISTCNIFGGGSIVGHDQAITNDIQTLANILTPLFHHDGFLDVVPSDVVAGIILVRLEQRQGRLQLKQSNQVQSTIEEGSKDDSSIVLYPGEGKAEFRIEYHRLSAYKRQRFAHHRILDHCKPSDVTLMQDISFYAKLSLSMYTHLLYLYMKPLSGGCKLCYYSASRGGCCGGRIISDAHVLGDNSCSFNQVALMRFTKKLNIHCIYATFINNTIAKPFAVFADLTRKTVIISIRGTLSLEDLITDMNFSTASFTFQGRECGAHRGMLDVAKFVHRELEANRLIERAFEWLNERVRYQSPSTVVKTNEFNIVTTGHSLGAGAACILAFLLYPTYPQVRCFTYGTPAATVDDYAAHESKHFITSVILGSDIVGRLSLSTVALLREQILDAISRAKVNKMEIIQSLFKEYEVDDLLYPVDAVPDTLFKRNLDKFNEKMKNEVNRATIPLNIPGKIIHFAKITTVGKCFGKSRRYVPVETNAEEFDEVQVSPTMLWEHLPDRYVDEIDTLLEEWLNMNRRLSAVSPPGV